MSFERMYVTNKGSLLSAKTLQGKQITFDHVEIGSGTISGEPASQESLATKEVECTINSIKVVNTNQIRISFLLTNKNLTKAFYFREIGLFAKDPDTNAEVLYAYANAGENAEYINNSSTSVIEKYININAAIDNAENVTINVDPTQAYVSQQEFEAAIEDIEAEIEQKISSVYKYKGSVTNYSNLPTTGRKIGDVYNIETADSTHGIKAGDNVAWNGTSWDPLAGTVDLSAYLTSATADNTYAKKASLAPNTMNLTPSMFVQDGEQYKCTVTNTQVTASSTVWVDISKDTMPIAEEAGVKSYITTNAGSFDIYSDAVPSANITGSYIILGGA